MVAAVLLMTTGCKRDNSVAEDDNSSVYGKWKLSFVGYMDENISPAVFDYSQNDIIYDFKGNNVLVISGEMNSIDDYKGHEKGEYYYKKHPIPPCGPTALCIPQITIGTNTHGIFFGWIFFESYEGGAMHIHTGKGTLMLVKQ